MTLAVDSTTIDYDHPTATVSGTVTIDYPGGTTAPYHGPVSLDEEWGQGSSPTLTTTTAGVFSIKVTPPYDPGAGLPDYLSAQVAGSSTARGGSSTVVFNVTPNPTKLTVKLSPKNSVTYGTAVKATGSLTYQRNDAGSYVPFATPMQVAVYAQGKTTPTATAKTASNGSFSIALPKATGETWHVQFSPASSLLEGQDFYLPLYVTIPTVYTGFKGTVNKNGGVVLSACLGFTTSVPGTVMGGQVVNTDFQWAASKNGPWNDYPQYNGTKGSCGHGGTVVYTNTTAERNAAYYRAYYLGASPIQSWDQTGYGKATSGVIYLKVP